MQRLGVCALCPDGHKRMVYSAIDPATGELRRICQRHEALWAEQRQPAMPREEYETAYRPWRQA